jgi:hypothetical protein
VACRSGLLRDPVATALAGFGLGYVAASSLPLVHADVTGWAIIGLATVGAAAGGVLPLVLRKVCQRRMRHGSPTMSTGRPPS